MPPPQRALLASIIDPSLTPAHSLCVCLCLRHLIARWFCVSCPPFAGSVRATRQSLQVAATHLARDADHRVRLGASCRPRASSSSKLRHLSVWPHSRRAREPRRAMYRIGRHTVAARVRLHHQDHQVLAVSPASQPPTLAPALEAAHPSAGLPPRRRHRPDPPVPYPHIKRVVAIEAGSAFICVVLHSQGRCVLVGCISAGHLATNEKSERASARVCQIARGCRMPQGPMNEWMDGWMSE